jgi:ATP-dependent DNA ligase
MYSNEHYRFSVKRIFLDLLWLNSRDLRRRPMIERKRLLRSIVPADSPVLYTDGVDGRGTDCYRAVCDSDLEAMVAKRRDGLYTPEATSMGEDPEPAVFADGRPTGVVRVTRSRVGTLIT